MSTNKGYQIIAPEEVVAMPPEKIIQMLYELQAHQIELKIQNDELRAKQAELEAEHARYVDLVDMAPVGIFTTSSDGQAIFANPQMAHILGVNSPQEAIDNFADLAKNLYIDPSRRKMFINLLKERGEVKNFEYEARGMNGKHLWLIMNARVRDKLSDGTFIIDGFTTDITQQKLTEVSIRESEERYHDIFNNLTDVYYKTALDGTIENVSPSAKTIFGYSPSELTGKKVDLLYHNPKDRDGFLAELRQKGQARGYEILFKKKNGKLYHASINADLNYDTDGEPIYLTGTIRDITESKLVEKEKILAQKIAADNEKYSLVGQIAGKMAHDFNNILAAIMGNSELALLDCTDPQITKRLELIYNQSIRGKNLTKNLVAFAKDQEPKQEYFRINDKIELVLNLLQKELDGIDVIREYGFALPDMLADPGMIEHTLVNLVQNSIHATSLIEHPKIEMRTFQQGKRIGIEIEDNGCGIPEKYLEKIFEPSFTLKGSKDKTGSYKSDIKGTGYGMSNVKRYVDQHKGMISIASIVGKGTRTILDFPVMEKQLTEQEKAQVQQESFYYNKYILLVEDEQAISEVQYRILTTSPCNHKVDIAPNGVVAIDLLKRNKYDFVSLDYLLPGGINGMNVYNHIRKSDKTTPILFVSGNLEFLESIKALQEKDFNVDHLSKPCQNLDYIKSINKLMNTSKNPFPQK